jgi:hypothetical protein
MTSFSASASHCSEDHGNRFKVAMPGNFGQPIRQFLQFARIARREVRGLTLLCRHKSRAHRACRARSQSQSDRLKRCPSWHRHHRLSPFFRHAARIMRDVFVCRQPLASRKSSTSRTRVHSRPDRKFSPRFVTEPTGSFGKVVGGLWRTIIPW